MVQLTRVKVDAVRNGCQLKLGSTVDWFWKAAMALDRIDILVFIKKYYYKFLITYKLSIWGIKIEINLKSNLYTFPL